jgi:inner membrane protein
MDPITHGLAGTTIANLGFKRRFAFWVLIISSIAPDIDYITRIWGEDVFLRYHRGISHGILALFIVPLIKIGRAHV